MKKFNVLYLILVLAMTGTVWANYLENPSFEDPDPNSDNWIDPYVPEPEEWDFFTDGSSGVACYYMEPGADFGDVEYLSPAHDGDDYVALYIPADATGEPWAIVYQQQWAAEAIEYTAEAYARVNPADSNAVIALGFRDGWGGLIREDVIEVTLADTAWHKITIDSNGPAPIGTRIVSATIYTTAKAVEVNYDSVSLIHDPAYDPITDCELTQFIEDWDFDITDLTRDCITNMDDFAALAEFWLRCNAVGCPDYPNWVTEETRGPSPSGPDNCDLSKMNAIMEIGYWPPLPGDINQDCYVNFLDIEELVIFWLGCTLDPNSNCP